MFTKPRNIKVTFASEWSNCPTNATKLERTDNLQQTAASPNHAQSVSGDTCFEDATKITKGMSMLIADIPHRFQFQKIITFLSKSPLGVLIPTLFCF